MPRKRRGASPAAPGGRRSGGGSAHAQPAAATAPRGTATQPRTVATDVAVAVAALATVATAAWWNTRDVNVTLALVVAVGVLLVLLVVRGRWTFFLPRPLPPRSTNAQRQAERNAIRVENFEAFADALRQLKHTPLEAGTAVNFGVPTLDCSHEFKGPSKVYVRECYLPLLEEYFNDDVEPDKRRVVVGHPGIGKSALRLLVALTALSKGMDVAFAERPGPNRRVYIVSSDGEGDCELESLRDSDDVASCVVITDASMLGMSRVEGVRSSRCWYFPRDDPADSDKPIGQDLTFLWLPLWTRDELQDAARRLSLRLTHASNQLLPDPCIRSLYADDASGATRSRIVDIRYTQFGGVARVVLAEDGETVVDHVECTRNALMQEVLARAGGLFDNLWSQPRLSYTLVGALTTWGDPNLPRKWWYKARPPRGVPRSVDWLSKALCDLTCKYLTNYADIQRYDAAAEAAAAAERAPTLPRRSPRQRS